MQLYTLYKVNRKASYTLYNIPTWKYFVQSVILALSNWENDLKAHVGAVRIEIVNKNIIGIEKQ